MRVGVISSQVFSLPIKNYGGLEVIAWECAKGLAELGHQVTIIAPDGSTCPNCKVIETGPPGQWDEKRAYEKYWKQLVEFDCIVDHSWGKWPMIGKQEGWLKIPSLNIMHAPVNTMLQSLPEGIEKPCFVCISKDQATHFEALFSHPARVAYNGVDVDFYKSLEIPRSDRYLFLARFSTIKGPLIAAESCKTTNTKLDMVGDNVITAEPEYFKQCESKCDGNQIKMIGPATRGSCVWWFSQAKCLLHPNRLFREPFGLAPVEAMLCGCPVIAWNYGAMSETISTGISGFLVKSQTEMEELIKTDAVSKIDRKSCREWALRFSIQNMVKRYDELCNEAVNSGGW